MFVDESIKLLGYIMITRGSLFCNLAVIKKFYTFTNQNLQGVYNDKSD